MRLILRLKIKDLQAFQKHEDTLPYVYVDAGVFVSLKIPYLLCVSNTSASCARMGPEAMTIVRG